MKTVIRFLSSVGASGLWALTIMWLWGWFAMPLHSSIPRLGFWHAYGLGTLGVALGRKDLPSHMYLREKKWSYDSWEFHVASWMFPLVCLGLGAFARLCMSLA